MRSGPGDNIAGNDPGVGIGLRSVHYQHVLSRRPAVPWFEATTENYLGLRDGSGGRPLEVLEKIRRDYPVALHGVSLNVGSADPLNNDYLVRVKELIRRMDPLYVSDHLCWTGVAGQNLHDLLPFPFNRETLGHLVPRIRRVQDSWGRRILLENVSSYIHFRNSEMTEWEFLAELAEQADCGILLDVNNIFVSAANQGFDPMDYLAGIPVDKVGYMHLAGYSDMGSFFIDTHDHPVSDGVWSLYADALKRFGARPTLIEWDANIPAFETLLHEAGKAEAIRKEAAHGAAVAR